MTSQRKILIVTYAGQGHINPSILFATRLMKMGIHVIVSSSVSVVEGIDKKTIPQGLTFAPFCDGHDSGKQPTTSLEQYVSDFATNGACAVAEIISSAAAAGQPFDHLFYTTVVPWAAGVANTHGIKSSLLWCQSATILNIYYYYFNEYEGLFRSSIENCNPTFPINLPGLPPLTTADLPSFLVPSNTKEHHFIIQLMKDHIDVLKIDSPIFVNSFKELEVESIGTNKQLQFLPIGPLIHRNKQATNDDYIEWLNTKPKSSVVYVSFGTLANLSMDQLEEVAIGLLESGRPFLRVIRDGEEAGKLSKIEELNKHGMIVGWCAQVVVLSHQAIGCFVTHGGWNSTLETLAAGVPTVVFPQWSDQRTNGKMMEGVWRTGIRVKRMEGDEMVKGKEIERCVEMVNGDEDIKKNAQKWRELATEALNDGGSSVINLLAFLEV